MRSKRRWLPAALIMALAIGATLFLAGCEGSDAEKAVKQTVEDFSGKSMINKEDKLRKQINATVEKQLKDVQEDAARGPGED